MQTGGDAFSVFVAPELHHMASLRAAQFARVAMEPQPASVSARVPARRHSDLFWRTGLALACQMCYTQSVTMGDLRGVAPEGGGFVDGFTGDIERG